MDGIINSIKSLFTTYGFRATAVIVLTIAIVNLIKLPIVKVAKKKEAATGVDKSVITKFITLLPIAVAFLLEFAIELVIVGFNFKAIAFGELFSKGALYGALAVATYEGVKKQLEAYAAKRKNANAVKIIKFNTND